jgi:gamma-glutamyltranspeptidase / glutathione hydrolase / leukotriene-C4 hydrolase
MKYLLILISFLFIAVSAIKANKYIDGKYAIVSNYDLCSKIGKRIIKYGGNGYDAAIAIMLCEGVTRPQDMGLGGGFIGIIKPKNHKSFIINSREVSPLSINLQAYNRNVSSKILGKTIGIPSALTGYSTLKKFGRLSWYNITKDVVKLAKNGFPVIIGDVLNKKQYQFIEEMNRNIFINPKTELPYANGEMWKRPDLANTIKNIGKYGLKAIKNSVIKKEINEWGGNITNKDFKYIKTKFHKPLINYYTFNDNRYKLETIPLPGGGPSLEFILKIMELYLKNNKPSERMYYVLIESFKYAFAFRSEYGDPKFLKYKLTYNTRNPVFIKKIYNEIMSRKTTKEPSKYYKNHIYKPKFDYGTANIVVKTPTETIVITSSINLRFGSGIVSKKYGFVYNNQLSDFSLPTRTDAGHLKYSKNNFPEPLKTPLSSMSGSIIYKKGKDGKYHIKYALGAAGGPKIITSIAQVLTHIFSQKRDNIVDAIYLSRFHHQLMPNLLTTQKLFYKNHKNFLKRCNYTIDPVFMKDDYSAVTGIQLDYKNKISATFDPRRSGGVEIFI